MGESATIQDRNVVAWVGVTGRWLVNQSSDLPIHTISLRQDIRLQLYVIIKICICGLYVQVEMPKLLDGGTPTAHVQVVPNLKVKPFQRLIIHVILPS